MQQGWSFPSHRGFESMARHVVCAIARPAYGSAACRTGGAGAAWHWMAGIRFCSMRSPAAYTTAHESLHRIVRHAAASHRAIPTTNVSAMLVSWSSDKRPLWSLLHPVRRTIGHGQSSRPLALVFVMNRDLCTRRHIGRRALLRADADRSATHERSIERENLEKFLL